MRFRQAAAFVIALLFGVVMCSGCGAETHESSAKQSAVSGSGSSVATSTAAERMDPKPVESSEPTEGTEPLDSCEPTEETDPQLLGLHTSIDESGYQAGIAYIGYVGAERTEEEIRIFLEGSPYAEAYAFLCDAPLVDADGAELYAVVTTRKDRSASVYPADVNEEGTYDVHMEKPLYKGKGTDCFLLYCNMSEVHSNVSIAIQTGDERFFVNPMISGKDGRLENLDCYDFSMYTDGNETQDDVMIAYGLLLEADEVQSYVNLGMTLQYTGQIQVIDGRSCWIFALGTDHEEQFVRELYYGVCDNLIYSYDAITDTWTALGG